MQKEKLRKDRLRNGVRLTLVLLFVITFAFHSGLSLKDKAVASHKSGYNANSGQQFTTTLNYNQYFAIHTEGWEGNAGNIYSWSFTGSNSFVGITVRVMDSNNYSRFQNRIAYNYYIFSDGSKYSDSGEWTIPYTNTWYTVFLNLDSDHQSTDLTINVSMAPPATTSIRILSPSITTSTTTSIRTIPPRVTVPPQSTFIFKTTLSYGEYYTIFTEEEEGDIGTHHSWSFKGTNTNVGIIVQLMTADEFLKLKNGYSYSYYLLSDGRYYSDIGEFTLPFTDTWHFVFINLDLDKQDTTITIIMRLNPITTTSLADLPNLTTVSGPLSVDQVQVDWAATITTSTSIEVYRRIDTSSETTTTFESTQQPLVISTTTSMRKTTSTPRTTTTKSTPLTTTTKSTPRTTTTTKSVVPEFEFIIGIFSNLIVLLLWRRYCQKKHS